MKRLLVVAAAVVVLIVIGVVALVVEPPDDGRPPVGVRPALTAVEPGTDLGADAIDAVFSVDGRRLAVRREDGIVVFADGRERAVPSATGRVVAMAWFGRGDFLLVAEGPASTGELPVIDASGEVDSVVRLDRPAPPGSGHGMAVAPDGATAALVAVERPALGPEQRVLVVVDMATGQTSRLAPELVVADPVFLDDQVVAVTAQGRRGTEVVRIDLADGTRRRVGAGRVVGVVAGEVVRAVGRDVHGPGGRLLGRVEEGDSVRSVSPDGRLAVVRTRARRLVVREL